MGNKLEQKSKLAKNILDYASSVILVKLRMLKMAVMKCEFREIEGSKMCSDGRYFYYDPDFVIATYKTNYKALIRLYLHVLLHNIMLHHYSSMAKDSKFWDVATDLEVENIINEFGLDITATDVGDVVENYIYEISKDVSDFTAGKIYRWLIMHVDETKIDDMLMEIHADHHGMWYTKDSELSASNDERGEDNGADGGGSVNSESESRDMLSKIAEDNVDEWKEIAKRISMDMRVFSRSIGVGSASLTKGIDELSYEKYDYSQFLRKFAHLNEFMRVNEDEFDYIFYTYGLNTYGNVPLIEPLEYKEQNVVKELAIVIDTSGSVQGGIVEKFINKTFNMLHQRDNFATRYKICIIECDDEVQSYTMINNDREMENYIKNFTIHGMGGTDFRPAFEYVNSLVERGIFTRLEGLIYFTDGYGAFPTVKPEYKSAIVYLDDTRMANNEDVPSWLIKLVFTSDEIANI